MVNFTILHLYPQTLKINGEAGNVLALKERALRLGLDVNVSTHELGEHFPTSRPDFVFIGSGTLQATIAAANDLATNQGALKNWLAAGTKLLAVGTGFDLIAQELVLGDGTRIQGLGLTNTSHTVTGNHLVGEVLLSEEFAGYINSNRQIARSSEGFELGTVRFSDQKDLVGYIDGFKDDSVWATNVQGPFLPMNPKFADKILEAIFPDLVLANSLHDLDELAAKARKAISVRVGS